MTGMSISESGKLHDGHLETNADPGEDEDGVSPQADFGELVISWMADQTRGRKDFQAETQDSLGPFGRNQILRAFHRRDAGHS